MTYIESLTSILESMDYIIDGAAVLDEDKNPVKLPIKVKGELVPKFLVLPTTDILKINEWDKQVAFHPACENVTSGQSEIIKFLISSVKRKMIEKSFVIVGELLKLEASTEKKKSTYAKYLSKIPEVSPKTIIGYNSFVKGVGEKGIVDQLLKIFIDRKDYVDGQQYQRVVYLTSPLFEDTSDDALLMGIKLPTKASKVALRALLIDMLLGGELVRGSNAEIPYFDVLIRLWLDFSKKYNSIVKMISKDVVLKEINTDYEAVIDTFHDFRKRVPVLEGNTGEQLIKINKDDDDDTPPFDVDEVERNDRRLSKRDEEEAPRRRYREEEDDDDKPTSLAFFKNGSGGGRSDRRSRDSYKPGPLDNRLYTEERRSYRDRDRDRDRSRGSRVTSLADLGRNRRR